jgi:hypothetical protein
MIMDPWGMTYQIATRQTETILKAWFDEILPHTYARGRENIDDFQVIWPHITISPMWAMGVYPVSDADWFCDSRIMGQSFEFPARNGEEGLKELVSLRIKIDRALKFYQAAKARGEHADIWSFL